MLRFLGYTVLVLAMVFSAISLYSFHSFQRETAAAADSLLATLPGPSRGTVERSDLLRVPGIVRQWLVQAYVLGHPFMESVRIVQDVTLRLDKEGPWLEGTAEQWNRTSDPGFLWNVHLKMNPILHIVGRDRYQEGTGSMVIKLQSLLSVVDEEGPELDKATLVRYLAEIVWYPTAALEEYIVWEELDNRSARATIRHGGIEASGVFFFNEDGFPVRFEAARYRSDNGRYTQQPWIVTMGDHRELRGIIVPTEAEIAWQEPDGLFTWYRCSVTNLFYNE